MDEYEDEDETDEAFVREELSLERAKLLYDKRLGTALFSDEDEGSEEEDSVSKHGTVLIISLHILLGFSIYN